jgi:hypothetical protein
MKEYNHNPDVPEIRPSVPPETAWAGSYETMPPVRIGRAAEYAGALTGREVQSLSKREARREITNAGAEAFVKHQAHKDSIPQPDGSYEERLVLQRPGDADQYTTITRQSSERRLTTPRATFSFIKEGIGALPGETRIINEHVVHPNGTTQVTFENETPQTGSADKRTVDTVVREARETPPLKVYATDLPHSDMQHPLDTPRPENAAQWQAMKAETASVVRQAISQVAGYDQSSVELQSVTHANAKGGLATVKIERDAEHDVTQVEVSTQTIEPLTSVIAKADQDAQLMPEHPYEDVITAFRKTDDLIKAHTAGEREVILTHKAVFTLAGENVRKSSVVTGSLGESGKYVSYQPLRQTSASLGDAYRLRNLLLGVRDELAEQQEP